MNTDNVYIVLLLVLGIVVLSNLAMFAWARSMRGMKFDWFKNARNNLNQPFKTEGDSLDELRKRVDDLSKQKQKE